MDTVKINEIFEKQFVRFHYSALDYIDELLTLLTKHEEVQISENITEEAENVKVN